MPASQNIPETATREDSYLWAGKEIDRSSTPAAIIKAKTHDLVAELHAYANAKDSDIEHVVLEALELYTSRGDVQAWKSSNPKEIADAYPPSLDLVEVLACAPMNCIEHGPDQISIANAEFGDWGKLPTDSWLDVTPIARAVRRLRLRIAKFWLTSREEVLSA